MRVLILGGGGREHALGWKIAQSPLLEKLYFSPGNPGTANLGDNINLDLADIPIFAQSQKIDLVVAGPEAPLVGGVADHLAEIGVPCFGPVAAAARLEGSKDFAKQVMVATGIPTAAHHTFTDYEQALNHVRSADHPLVVKADGLAAGKGVTICHDRATSEQALREAMCDARFGEAGSKVVIEEFLEGVEASFHAICDGERILPLITAKDHKALYEGDIGPNTGGMGTYSPSPLISAELAKQIETQVCEPVFRYLRDQGHPFRGVLFTGLMLTKNGPKVLEFNVRFGDPETQVMMPMLDFDLLPVLMGAARGQLPSGDFGFKKGAAVCVVLAASGYPASVRKGDVITGLFEGSDASQVFQAGTKYNDQGEIVTNGGRVLGATAWGENLDAARTKAYELTNCIQFQGKFCRKDIGG